MNPSKKPRNNVELYKNRYFIVFYDETDEILLHIFNNIKEILTFQKKPITQQNINLVNVELCRGLKSDNHLVRFLTGANMRVYIIDDTDDEEEN